MLLILIQLSLSLSYLLRELALGYGLSAKLDVEGVSAGQTWGIEDADSAVTIVHNINVYIAAARTADVTRHVTVARVSCVDVDHTFLAHRDSCPDSI